MSEIFEKLGPIIDVATSGSSNYGKEQKINRAFAGLGLGLSILKGYKQKQYEDKVDQDSMDQWIKQGKLRDDISKLKQEKEDLRPYTEALRGIRLDDKAAVEMAIGNQIWQEVISTNESLRNAGKAKEIPTYADFQATKNYFNPQGATILEEAYQEKLNNMIGRVRTGKKIDIPKLEAHYSEIEKNKLTTDFLDDASLVDLYNGRTERKYQNKKDAIARYTNVHLTENIKNNALAFEDLKTSENLMQSKEKLINHQFSDVVKMTETNLAILHTLPPVVRTASMDALNAKFAAKEIVLGRRLTPQEINEESNLVMFSMVNPSEGIKAAYKQRAADLRDIHQNNSLTDKEKQTQIGLTDIALSKHIDAVGSMGDFSEAELKIHEQKGLDGVEDVYINENVPGANEFRARLRKALSAPQSIRASLVNSIMAEYQVVLQNFQNPSLQTEARNAQATLKKHLDNSNLPYTKASVDIIVQKNPDLSSLVPVAKKLGDGSIIYWKNYDVNFGDPAHRAAPNIYEETMNRVENLNPELADFMEKNKSNSDFKGAMAAWLSNTLQGFKNLSEEQFLTRSFGNNGTTVSADRAFRELLSGNYLLKNGQQIVNERDDRFFTNQSSVKALDEKLAREIYQNLSNQVFDRDAENKNLEDLTALVYKYDSNGNKTKETEFSSDKLTNLSSLSPKEAAAKVNFYMKNYINIIENTDEFDEKTKIEAIKEYRENFEEKLEKYPELELEFNTRTNNFRTISFGPVDEIQNRINEIDDILGKQTRRERTTKAKERQALDQERDDLRTLRGTRNFINMFKNKAQITEKEKENLTQAEQTEIELSNKYGY